VINCQVNCPAGTSFSPSGIGCTKCPAGKFSSTGGSGTFCSDCPFGQSSSKGSTSCGICGNGWFLDGKECLSSCPVGKQSAKFDNGSSVCVGCEAGSWNNIPGATVCKRCPIAAVCPEGSIVPWVDKGYYRSAFDPGAVTPCIPSDACSGTGYLNTTCSDGYSGVLCGGCASERFRSGGSCVKCMSKIVRWLIIIVSLLLLMAGFSTISEFQVSIPTSLRLLLFWFQFMSLFPSLSNAWPPVLLSLLDFTSFFNLDVGYLGFGCDIKYSYFVIGTIKLLLPIGFFVFLLFNGLFMRLIGRYKTVSSWSNNKLLLHPTVLDFISNLCIQRYLRTGHTYFSAFWILRVLQILTLDI
jgi:hypothetical protein